uniref:Uncharacterized protein n=1 Tax=Arundo donax TaxID=35708 RepID=A0A0A9B0E4_ARUDO
MIEWDAKNGNDTSQMYLSCL